MDRIGDIKHTNWAKAVKERDNFKCQICGRFGIELHSHHIFSYDIYIEERYKIVNGLTLCQRCHNDFHNIYGRGNNTIDQLNEYIQSYKIIKKSIKKDVK